MKAVFDIEADGLLDSVTKIHCLSYREAGAKEVKSLTSYLDMADFIESCDMLIGHNILAYDLPALLKITGARPKKEAVLVDTLALSWYLHPEWLTHGLEAIGQTYGIPKPKIDDWENLSIEEYIHRCEEDVKINYSFWRDCLESLNEMYNGKPWELINYLTFKMQCAADQAVLGWKLNVPLAEEWVEKLSGIAEERIKILEGVMPPVPVYKTIKKPLRYFKLNGELSAAGEKWEEATNKFEGTLTEDTFTYQSESAPPNVNSVSQVKSWLFSLGWEPCTFEYKKEVDDTFRAIPQVYYKNSGGQLTESIMRLSERTPELESFTGLSIVKHRLGILKGMLESADEQGYLEAEIGGLTNTLRFKHRAPLTNLPGVDKEYGDIIRGVLTCEEGEVLCGSDMSSLEDRTKQHYIWEFDPEYVAEMNKEGFDPHLDLAISSGALSEEEAEGYKAGTLPKEDMERVGKIRKNYKGANYACVYGVGAPKLAITLGISEKEAQEIIDAYWKRNWAVKAVAESLTTRTFGGILWLFNPVSGFWYSLRTEKDKFSTLNQSTGAYCFDCWVRKIKTVDVSMGRIVGQFHDEVVGRGSASQKEATETYYRECLEAVNNELKLNRALGISVKFGNTYAEIH